MKDHFFYGIRSDIRNSIHHFYNDEMVTFSQLLVKAHQHEEEDNTPKLLSKSVVADSTLEYRVDKLIERCNKRSNSSLNRVNWDDNCNYGTPPFQQNQRSRGDFWTNSHPTVNDIWQNLRGPEPSAAGPFGESDVSRPKLDNYTPFKERYQQIPPTLFDEVKTQLKEMI